MKNNPNENKYLDYNNFKITYSEIISIFENIVIEKEPDVPFPQANSTQILIELLFELKRKPLTTKEIAKMYNFQERQASYYISAGIYFNFIEKNYSLKNYNLTKECNVNILKTNKEFVHYVIKQILSFEVFHNSFKKMLDSSVPLDTETIYQIMLYSDLKNLANVSTYKRRASTVKSWIDWITSLI